MVLVASRAPTGGFGVENRVEVRGTFTAQAQAVCLTGDGKDKEAWTRSIDDGSSRTRVLKTLTAVGPRRPLEMLNR